MITLSAVALSEFNQEALCQCNSKCKDFGDCCMDYEEVCLKSCKGLCRNGEQVKRENVVGFVGLEVPSRPSLLALTAFTCLW